MSLELHLVDIQQRFGFQAPRPAPELTPVRDMLPTGLHAADELLDGGLLSGAIHCISGAPTSGAASLLYHALASAQAGGLPVVYLDMERRLDPPDAAAAGVELGRLLLLKGASLKRALSLIRYLAQQRLPCLIALDHPAALPIAQLKAILRDAPLTILALSPQLLPGMQVTLECQRQDWLSQRRDIDGFISQLRLTAHPYLPFRQVRACFDIPRQEACSARW